MGHIVEWKIVPTHGCGKTPLYLQQCKGDMAYAPNSMSSLVETCGFLLGSKYDNWDLQDHMAVVGQVVSGVTDSLTKSTHCLMGS